MSLFLIKIMSSHAQKFSQQPLETDADQREMISDFSMNQAGCTRIVEEDKFKIKKMLKTLNQDSSIVNDADEDKSTLNFMIDKMLMIDMPDQRLFMYTLESKDMEIIDFDTFKTVHKFVFKSNYIRPNKLMALQKSSKTDLIKQIENKKSENQKQISSRASTSRVDPKGPQRTISVSVAHKFRDLDSRVKVSSCELESNEGKQEYIKGGMQTKIKFENLSRSNIRDNQETRATTGVKGKNKMTPSPYLSLINSRSNSNSNIPQDNSSASKIQNQNSILSTLKDDFSFPIQEDSSHKFRPDSKLTAKGISLSPQKPETNKNNLRPSSQFFHHNLTSKSKGNPVFQSGRGFPVSSAWASNQSIISTYKSNTTSHRLKSQKTRKLSNLKSRIMNYKDINVMNAEDPKEEKKEAVINYAKFGYEIVPHVRKAYSQINSVDTSPINSVKGKESKKGLLGAELNQEYEGKEEYDRSVGAAMKRRRMFSSLKKRKEVKMYGILGIDQVLDEETKILLQHYSGTKSSIADVQNSLQVQFYPHGLNSKLFQSKATHERVKTVFKRFEKSLDQEFRDKDQEYDHWKRKHDLSKKKADHDKLKQRANTKEKDLTSDDNNAEYQTFEDLSKSQQMKMRQIKKINSNNSSKSRLKQKMGLHHSSNTKSKQTLENELEHMEQEKKRKFQEIKEMAIESRICRLDNKCEKVGKFNRKLEYVMTYPIKVADSYQIQKPVDKMMPKKVQTEMDKEQMRISNQNKQEFLIKISKEIEEKEKINAQRKKRPLNLEEILQQQTNENKHEKQHKFKKFQNKKIYPVCVSYHQETRHLAICLIDKESKVYQIKQTGINVNVIELFSFNTTFIPCTSHMAQHKIQTNVIMLILASEDGTLEIYSLADEAKSKPMLSTRIRYSIPEHGPISKAFYHKDVGLLISTFKGMLQVYDSMEFKLMWETSNSSRKIKSTIATFDFSQAAGMIAVGGAEGKILVFDPSAKILSAHAEAHKTDIMDLYYYDKQMQLISVAMDRTIMLWDTLKLECIQVIKDQAPQARSYSSTCFNYSKGVLLTACIFIKLWRAKIDPQVEFESIQRKAITKNALKDKELRIRKQLETLEETKKNVDLDPRDLAKMDQLRDELEASKTYVTSCFDNLQSYNYTGNVLVTKQSKLVSVLIMETKDQLITLDSDYLMRVWSISTGKQQSVFLLKSKCKKKLTCGALDPSEDHLAISDEDGQITVHNIHSAGLLHSPDKIGTEISQLQFMLTQNTNFWMTAIGWEGKVAFIKQPVLTKKTYSVPIILKKSVHQGDLYAVDQCDNYVATGGVDNKVVIWNALSGTVRSKLDLPKSKPNTFICAIRFLKNRKQTMLFVLQNTGDFHFINPITEAITLNILHVQTNAMLDFSSDLRLLLSVGEQGKGTLYETNLESYNPSRQSPFLRYQSKLERQLESESSLGRADFDLRLLKEWTTHKIIPQQNQAVIICKFSKIRQYFLTALNSGEVKVWSLNGDLLSMINDSNYPVDVMEKMLVKENRVVVVQKKMFKDKKQINKKNSQDEEEEVID